MILPCTVAQWAFHCVRKRVDILMLRLKLSRIVGLIALLVSMAACSNLAGEVEIVATITPTVINQPPAMPDVLNGQRIFAENCTQCHGELGDGGGAMVQSGEVPRMPSFLEAAHVREQTPAFYYDMITNGNLANLMPPWSEALTEQERWDVALYVYALHYTPEQVLRGAALNPEATSTFSLQSDAAMSPATGLQGDDAWAAVAYQRVRSIKNYGLLTGVEIPGISNDAPPPESMTFTGTVSQGTAGATIPAGLQVELRYGNFAEGFATASTTIDATNTYRFDNIPYVATSFYLTTAAYQGVVFQSMILLPNQLGATNDLPLTITERTEDTAVVTLTNINIAIDSTTVDGMGAGMVLQQTNTYVNNSDRTLYLSPTNQEVSVSLLVQLPPGALILNDTENPRYIVAQDFYSLIDTNPVFPGEHIVKAVYFLPHTEGDALIDLELNNPFEGALDISVAVPSLTVTGDVLEYTGEETVQGTTGDVVLKNYHADYSIPSGGNLVFTVSGSLFGDTVADDNPTVISGNFLVPVIIFIVTLFVAAFVALILMRRRYTRTTVDNQREIDRLLAQISQLEAMHEKGEINHDVFQRQRKELKDKLTALMRTGTAANDN
jgi:mono/diheme cytochrome c family protein